MTPLEEQTGLSDVMKGMPGPLELARMHEAKLKQCYKQYSVLGALVRQIMVGRVVTVSAHSARCEVTDIKLHFGQIEVYGKPKGKKRQTLLCIGLQDVTIVEGTKP